MERRIKNFLASNDRWPDFSREFENDMLRGDFRLGVSFSHRDNKIFTSDGKGIPEVIFEGDPVTVLIVYGPYTVRNNNLAFTGIAGLFRLKNSTSSNSENDIQDLWTGLSNLDNEKVSKLTLDESIEVVNRNFQNYPTKTQVNTQISNVSLTPGPRGVPGPSAYNEWLLEGNTGSFEDYLQTLRGPRGEDGTGVTILGSFATVEELPASGQAGDSYLVNGDLYVWSENSLSWDNVGNIQGPQGEVGPKGDKGDPGTTDFTLLDNVPDKFPPEDYTPPFTDSTQRSISSKLSEFVSVKDFGAVGDGIADDTVAFQSAIDALPLYGGCIIIPSGRYVITSEIVVAKSDVIIQGTARHGKLWKTTEYQGSFILIGANISGSVFRFTTTGGSASRGCGIKDLSFNGNERLNTCESAVHVENSDQFRLENVDFEGILGRALWTQRCVKSSFRNVDVYRCGDSTKPAVHVSNIDTINYTQGSVFDSFAVETCYSSPYMQVDSISVTNKLVNLGFESDTANIDTQHTYLQVNADRTQIQTIHTNKMDELSAAKPRIRLAGNYITFANYLGMGRSPSHHIDLSGSQSILSDLVVQYDAETSFAVVYGSGGGGRNRIQNIYARFCMAVQCSSTSHYNKCVGATVRKNDNVTHINNGTGNNFDLFYTVP